MPCPLDRARGGPRTPTGTVTAVPCDIQTARVDAPSLPMHTLSIGVSCGSSGAWCPGSQPFCFVSGRSPCFRGFLACLGGAAPGHAPGRGSLPAVRQCRQQTRLLASGPSAPCSPGLPFCTAGPFLCFRTVRTPLLQGVSPLSCAWPASPVLIPVQLLARSGVCHVSFAVRFPGGHSAPRRGRACMLSCSAVSLGASSGLHIGSSLTTP